MKIAVITAVYGAVDKVPRPVEQETSDDVHFLIFGDKAEGWESRNPAFGSHVPNVYKARSIKTCPHMFTKKGEFDAFLWIDGCIEISGAGFVKSHVELLADSQIGFYMCNTNKDLAQHIRTLNGLPLFKTLGLTEQVKSYLDQGYEDKVLYETGVHIRRNLPEVNAMCNEWMSNLFLWCYRDQFSLPYVLWRHGIQPAILGPSVWRTENHKHHGHTPEYARVRHRNTDGTDRWTPPDGGNPAVSP